MHETTGLTAYDYSPKDRTATYDGNTLANAKGVDGRVCPLFDGGSNGVEDTNNLTDYSVSKGSVVVPFKFYDASALTDSNFNCIWSMYIDAQNSLGIAKNTANTFRVKWVGQNVTYTLLVDITGMDTSKWHFVVCTWDIATTTIRVWLDGIEKTGFVGVMTAMVGSINSVVVGNFDTVQALAWYGWLGINGSWKDTLLTPSEAVSLSKI